MDKVQEGIMGLRAAMFGEIDQRTIGVFTLILSACLVI